MNVSNVVKEELFNWDHEIHPTPVEDMAQNIHAYIAKNFDSPKHVRVAFDADELIIEVLKTSTFAKGASFGVSCAPHWSRVVHANFNCGIIPREFIGRVGHWLPVNLYTLDKLIKLH